MTSVPRLPRILLASAFALAAFAAAPALAEPAAPAPVPLPYPNTSPPNASSLNAAPRDAASGLPSGKRMHKPVTLTTSAAGAADCATNAAPVDVATSDPQEGGEVARAAGRNLNAAPVDVATSDPQEGGEIARKAGKPHLSEIPVVKVMDKATPSLAAPAPSGASCPTGQH